MYTVLYLPVIFYAPPFPLQPIISGILELEKSAFLLYLNKPPLCLAPGSLKILDLLLKFIIYKFFICHK